MPKLLIDNLINSYNFLLYGVKQFSKWVTQLALTFLSPKSAKLAKHLSKPKEFCAFRSLSSWLVAALGQHEFPA